MESIERKLVLPNGAKPLSRYRRYYFLSGEQVIGVYFAYHPPGREWLEDRKDAPQIFDGGCSVVNVTFETTTGEIQAFCNGMA